ncbi:hypothetical protein Hdeb2414_s0228g00840611 [Helianthus debilis subsp. tardiflorus]
MVVVISFKILIGSGSGYVSAQVGFVSAQVSSLNSVSGCEMLVRVTANCLAPARVSQRSRFRFGFCTIGFGLVFGSNMVKAGQPWSRCLLVTGSGHWVKR